MNAVKLRELQRKLPLEKERVGWKQTWRKKMWVLYIFDVILHETERENIQVRTLDKKGDSLWMEEDLLEQSCQRKEQECVSLSENKSSYKTSKCVYVWDRDTDFIFLRERIMGTQETKETKKRLVYGCSRKFWVGLAGQKKVKVLSDLTENQNYV